MVTSFFLLRAKGTKINSLTHELVSSPNMSDYPVYNDLTKSVGGECLKKKNLAMMILI